jgi:RNA polymerase sigma-70 factor (family 1)
MTDGLNGLSIAWSSKIDIFEKSFSQHYNQLFISAVKKVQSEDLAKDLLQETFIALWDNLDSIKTEQEILPYLFGTLRNKVLMHYRKSEVHLKYAVDAVNQHTEYQSSEHILLNKELETIIGDEISKMPSRMRLIYRLKKENNNSVKEIAAELGLSEQTVKNQLQNAYSRLKLRLKDYNSPVIIVGFVMSHMPVLLHH